MLPSRPGRTAVRRGLLILIIAVLVPVGTLAVSPVLSERRLGEPPTAAALPTASPATTAPPAVIRDGPELVVRPGAAPSPVVSVIQQVPREPRGLTASAAARSALDDRLDRLREKYRIPGMSVTILYPDGTRWVGASGFADLEAGVPVTNDTAFAVASISKTFTAALILALAEDGLLDLDDAVLEYLPAVDLDPKITIRQLLDHTSGLHDYFYSRRIDRELLAEPDRRWSARDALDHVGDPYFRPGRGWHYSNTNYLLLGLVAERAAGERLADQLRERFLEPLGLDGTHYQPTEEAPGPLAHGYRFSAGADGEVAVDLTGDGAIAPFTSVVTAAGGAGAVAATSPDIARWARALYAGSALSQVARQEMVDDIARTAPFGPTVPYGLGVQQVTIAGAPSLGHSGRLLGFRSVVRHLPDTGITIAVLTNQSRTDPGIVARSLLGLAMRPVETGAGARR